MPSTAPTVLRGDTSGRYHGSHSRALTNSLLARGCSSNPALQVLRHDLAAGLPQVNEHWIEAAPGDGIRCRAGGRLRLPARPSGAVARGF